MIQKNVHRLLMTGFVAFISSLSLMAQHKVEMLPFGDMDQWVDRQIKESSIIGGNTKNVYAIGPTTVIKGDQVYKNMGGSPWATSNVMAKVAGITKTNTSVFPEKRGDGYCARLDTRMESVKVLGLVNITVLAAGSVFTGSVHEPIKGTKNPQKMLQTGIPFTKKPVALQFDYKVKMSDRENRIRATGFSKITDVPGKDYPAAILLLQKRWEDANGNVYAKRIGTMVTYYYHSTDWKNNATYEIMYGDITNRPEYKSHMMRLQATESYTVNSKGESVPIHEVAWGNENDVPTHMCLQFTSSHGGAYIGSPGNTSVYIGGATINKIKHLTANKTVAWIDYMTNYNRTYGDFATGETLDFMVLNRRYDVGDDNTIKDLTTYIDPQKYIEIFADTDLTSQNFWVQTIIQATRRGNYSAKQIPFL